MAKEKGEAMAKEKEEAMAKEKEEAMAKEKEEMVTFQLHKDSSKYSSDVFVGINGKTWLIKRGVPVELPKPVYDVLAESMHADALLAERIANTETQTAE